MRSLSRTRPALVFAAMALISTAGCNDDPTSVPQPVASVSIQAVAEPLMVGATLRLTVVALDVTGEIVTGRPVGWSSSDEAVATVNAEGVATGLAEGQAVITAECEGKTGTVDLVVEVEVGSVLVEADTNEILPGTTLQLRAKALSADYTELIRQITWRSLDPMRATVNEQGVVTGRSEGPVSIEASTRGVSGRFRLTVLAPVATITVTPANVIMNPGDHWQLQATVRDAAGSVLNRPVTWYSPDPSVATVDQSGLVVAVGLGQVTLQVTCEGAATTVDVVVQHAVATVEVTPASATLAPQGATIQLTATPKAADGTVLDRPVHWSTSDAAVADVDANGLVTSGIEGSAVIDAQCEYQAGQAQIVVEVPAASIVITDPGQEPLEIGLTSQLDATVYDATGSILNRPVTWSSADDNIATVDQAGLVTGVGRGTVDITASYQAVSATVNLRVVGEGGTYGNNLSWPVVFAEGHGLTGELVSVEHGLRPTTGEGIQVDALPFFWSGNMADYGAYYTQQSANTWQAEWADGSTLGTRSAEAVWGDNLTHQTWDTHSVIRIELALADLGIGQLTGFPMTPLYGSGPDEMQGTDGTTAPFVPTIYSIMPRLTIEKLDDATLQPIEIVFDGAIWEGGGGDGPNTFGAEVNVAGRIVYGMTWMIRDLVLTTPGVHKYGWWRLTLTLDAQGQAGGGMVGNNISLDSVVGVGDPSLVYPPGYDAANQKTWLDVYVNQASGGGGGH